MAEICTPPAITVDPNGDEWAAFGPHHSLGDITRWLMGNRSEAEEVYRMLGEMLEDTPPQPGHVSPRYRH